MSKRIEVSDVMIIADKKWEGHFSDLVDKLRAMGMTIDNTDEDDGVIEGTIDASKLADVQRLDGVDDVRNVMTYIDREGDADADVEE
jgi:hypothetical protein